MLAASPLPIGPPRCFSVAAWWCSAGLCVSHLVPLVPFPLVLLCTWMHLSMSIAVPSRLMNAASRRRIWYGVVGGARASPVVLLSSSFLTVMLHHQLDQGRWPSTISCLPVSHGEIPGIEFGCKSIGRDQPS